MAAAACLVLTALPLLAQQGGERIIGGPPNPDIAARIRGVPQRLLAASEDQLPTQQLKLPQGFKVETYISGIADARSLRIGDKKNYIETVWGRGYALREPSEDEAKIPA
jgi:hypothetical protein